MVTLFEIFSIIVILFLDETWVLVVFLIQSLTFIFTLPFLFAPQLSLFSKVTNEETQG